MYTKLKRVHMQRSACEHYNTTTARASYVYRRRGSCIDRLPGRVCALRRAARDLWKLLLLCSCDLGWVLIGIYAKKESTCVRKGQEAVGYKACF